MTPRILRGHLLSAWWSITRSMIALGRDRRMTVGLADELADAAFDFSRYLANFREDVSVSRFGPRSVDEERRS